MKKTLQIFALFALAFMLTGCSYDYTCTVTLNIVNLTDAEIVLIMGTEGTSERSIMPGKEVNAYESIGMCGKNSVPEDYYPEDMRLMDYAWRKLKVNGRIVSGELWARKYWDFTSEVYHATLTLSVTDELIENVGFEEE